MHFNKKLFSFAKGVKGKFIAVIGNGFGAAAFTVLQAILLAKIIDEVFLKHKSLGEEKYNLLFFLGISLAKALLIWAEQYFAAEVVKHVKSTVRRKLLNKIRRLGPVRLSLERTGELSNTVIKGTDALEKYFSQYLPQLFLSAIIPVLILFFVFPRDVLSGIVFIITAPVIPFFMYLIGSIAESLNKKQWKTLSRMSAYFLDVLQGMLTLKLFNATKREIKKIFEITELFRTTTMKVLRVAFLSALVLELLSTISIAIISVEIGLRLLAGNILFVDAMFLLIIAPEFYLPIRQLGTRYHAGLEGIAAFQRINAILEMQTPPEIVEGAPVPDISKEKIIFENVSFKYEQRNDNALDKVSFEIEPHKTTAIVGETGSGKSTVFNLLLKFIEPTEGKIYVGKEKLSDINSDIWRNRVSWLPQNPHLFHKSIFDNIALAKPNATLQEVIMAAKKARIHETIVNLPKGYETVAGESGSKLSGGQIQRIALARAFLKNAPLILIDEPTANLDPSVEEKILTAMKELTESKTVIIIAHRLNTVLNADKIIALHKGKILGVGTHHELLETSPYYAEMFKTYRSA
jgi:ATP-binding cassette subfamily C protein CydD